MLDYIYVIITKNDGLPTQQEAAVKHQQCWVFFEMFLATKDTKFWPTTSSNYRELEIKKQNIAFTLW